MDKSCVAATVGVDGTLLPDAMQKLVELALAKSENFEWLVVFEHDVIPPLDALTRIARYDHEYDIVGGMTFRHEYPHYVMVFTKYPGEALGYSPLTPEALDNMVQHPGVHAVDATAMGFTAIRREVFEKWDADIPMWQPTAELRGHDFHFCHEAVKQGFTIGADSGVMCGHLTVESVGLRHHSEALQSYLRDSKDAEGRVTWPVWH
jgi:hypothetical protein